MPDLALAAQGRQGADVRVHAGKDHSRVAGLAPNVLGAIVPIDAHRVHRPGGVVVGVHELHDAAQVVGLSRRLAHEIDVICQDALLAGANCPLAINRVEVDPGRATYHSPPAPCHRRPPFDHCPAGLCTSRM